MRRSRSSWASAVIERRPWPTGHSLSQGRHARGAASAARLFAAPGVFGANVVGLVSAGCRPSAGRERDPGCVLCAALCARARGGFHVQGRGRRARDSTFQPREATTSDMRVTRRQSHTATSESVSVTPHSLSAVSVTRHPTRPSATADTVPSGQSAPRARRHTDTTHATHPPYPERRMPGAMPPPCPPLPSPSPALAPRASSHAPPPCAHATGAHRRAPEAFIQGNPGRGALIGAVPPPGPV